MKSSSKEEEEYEEYAELEGSICPFCDSKNISEKDGKCRCLKCGRTWLIDVDV